jgi:hypothetical protein
MSPHGRPLGQRSLFPRCLSAARAHVNWLSPTHQLKRKLGEFDQCQELAGLVALGAELSHRGRGSRPQALEVR